METEIIIDQITIHLNEEKFLDFYMDASPTIYRHHKEVNPYQTHEGDQFSLEPDFTHYINLDNNGDLKIYTARVEKELVGYCGYVIYKHPHHTSKVIAAQDGVYFKKGFRNKGLGEKFLSWTEIKLKDSGVNVVHQSVTPWYDWSKTLNGLGYKPLETVYFKNI